jgi:hypothetical protein
VDVKEYISSGIIERYVFGLATDAEREEFERIYKKYPEVDVARDEFEIKLEQQIMQDAIEPPAHLKETIQNSIFKSSA